MIECVHSHSRALLDRFWSCRNPLAIIVLLGTIVHLALMLTSVNYDSDFWAIVARNIESGEGIYGLEGYYYTPVWGYIIGLVSVFQSIFMTIGETAVRVLEFIPVEGIDGFYLSATVPSVSFMLSIKVPLLISDLVMGYVVYLIVKDRTGDERKSVLAFALTFMCPILLGSSCIVGMPDTISIMFAILTLALVYKDHYFCAGMTFCMAALTKFFPVFMIFILISYVLSKHKGDRIAGYRSLGMAIAGSILVAVLVFLPQIMNGNLEQCFQFLTDRTGSSEDDGLIQFIAGRARIVVYALVIVATLVIAKKIMSTDTARLDDALLKGTLITMGLCMIYPPAPQYLVCLVPFLVLWIVLHEKRYLKSYGMISAGAFCFSLLANCMLFASLAVWTNIVSLETIFEINQFYIENSALILKIIFVSSGVIQYVGILVLMWQLFGNTFCSKMFRRDEGVC